MTCIHHWVIEPADGSSHSRGVCRNCGAEKQFRNSYPVNLNWREAMPTPTPIPNYELEEATYD